MNKHRKRAQAPKRINRHASSITDKGRARTGPIMRGECFDRNDYRSTTQRGEW